MMRNWSCAYELDRVRNPIGGSPDALAEAIRRGADVRLYTTFDWREHMGTAHPAQGLVEETIDLRVTYLLEDRWSAALTALRYPADAGLGFGSEPSLSFFMYNQDTQFGIARPYLTRPQTALTIVDDPNALPDFGPYYHLLDIHHDNCSPSHNAVYEFDVFRWLVCDDWEELLAHDADGRVVRGSLAALCEAFRQGGSIKVGVRDLCRELAPPNEPAVAHEVFIELGSMYNHVDQGFHSGESLPLVRIAPHIPLRYAASNWNFGWILPRTDGRVFHLHIDPYTREFHQSSGSYAIRWFAR